MSLIERVLRQFKRGLTIGQIAVRTQIQFEIVQTCLRDNRTRFARAGKQNWILAPANTDEGCSGK